MRRKMIKFNLFFFLPPNLELPINKIVKLLIFNLLWFAKNVYNKFFFSVFFSNVSYSWKRLFLKLEILKLIFPGRHGIGYTPKTASTWTFFVIKGHFTLMPKSLHSLTHSLFKIRNIVQYVFRPHYNDLSSLFFTWG